MAPSKITFHSPHHFPVEFHATFIEGPLLEMALF